MISAIELFWPWSVKNRLTTASEGRVFAGCTQAPTARTSTFLLPIMSVLITGLFIFRKQTESFLFTIVCSVAILLSNTRQLRPIHNQVHQKTTKTYKSNSDFIQFIISYSRDTATDRLFLKGFVGLTTSLISSTKTLT